MNNLGKHIIIYITIVVLLIVGAFSLTYSYFFIKPNEDETVSPSQVITGKLVLDFVTSTYINIDNFSLIDDVDKNEKAPYTEFKVSHNVESNVSASYNIFITELEISDNFKSPYFKWELVRLNDGTEQVLNSGNFVNATSGNDFKLSSNDITLDVDETHNYIFRIWLSNDPDKNQLELTNGSFKGKIKIVAANS